MGPAKVHPKPNPIHRRPGTPAAPGENPTVRLSPLWPPSIFPPSRDVAQLGSAPEWGSGGRRFESGRPDCEKRLPRLRLRPWAGFLYCIPLCDSRC